MSATLMALSNIFDLKMSKSYMAELSNISVEYMSMIYCREHQYMNSKYVLKKDLTDNTMAKRKSTKGKIHEIKQKTKDRATQTTLKTRDEIRCSGQVGSSCSPCDTRRVTFKRHDSKCWGYDLYGSFSVELNFSVARFIFN